MRYTFDSSAEPGDRVIAVDVWDVATETYVPISPMGVYQLATNNFIADGGDGFSMRAGASSRYDTGWLLSDSLAEYLDANAPVAPVVEGRIRESSETTESDS
jgi:2',3'-cyclic-nucleotide 2'-phosphodiesterase (5'-nucleotidase family)